MRYFVFLATLILSTSLTAHSQRGGGRGAGGAAQTGQAAAPVDLTGYWVALVTEDWRWRMVTPKKGDFPNFTQNLNAAGRELANAWDPAKDEASGDECKSYGAGNVMRLPARLHITWADPNTLKIEVDNGNQTRLLRFGAPQNPAEVKSNPADPKNWQGNSVASWQVAGSRGGGPRHGELKVVTTGARQGYLQKNGVPYSANAVFTEYFNRYDEEGWTMLVVSTLTEDPTYLQVPHIRSSHFKKLPDAAGWNPMPCTAR
jgi:hypothetical protein